MNVVQGAISIGMFDAVNRKKCGSDIKIVSTKAELVNPYVQQLLEGLKLKNKIN